MTDSNDVLFFATPDEWRNWLAENHEQAQEVWVGYYKVKSGRPSLTWSQSVDEALCFGWIDGVRYSIDEISYKIRFTPRRAGSNWSAVNVKKVQALIAAGKMQPTGLKAYEAMEPDKSGVYSYEQTRPQLDPAYEEELRGNAAAWQFFQSQPAWYRRAAGHWVMEAKREETCRKRLATLIEDSAQGKTVGPLTRRKGGS